MTDEIRRALCKHNKDNPSLTQKQLQEWVHSNYGLQVSQATISNTVKRSLEYLSLAPERGDVKRHKPAKFPDLEKSLYEWILQYQEHVNMTGELMEPPSRNEAIKAAITLNNFLLSYEKTTPEVLTMLRKIRDEIQGEIDFNKKQKTIESFFKKPS
ncbi:CENP-B homolog protein 2-like protein [Tanacetum coccineum]